MIRIVCCYISINASNYESKLLLLVLTMCYGKPVSKLSLQSCLHRSRLLAMFCSFCRSAQLSIPMPLAASFRLMVFANVGAGVPRRLGPEVVIYVSIAGRVGVEAEDVAQHFHSTLIHYF